MPALSASQLDILLVLASGPRHGYAIMKTVDEELHGGQRRLGPAQLYTGLQKLLDLKMVRELDDLDPRKRVYEITPDGQSWALGEVARQNAFVSKARTLLGGGA